eukprot:CAMPEP_0196769462 /NCGR_PEP_ID=MMETSP1104-20130614/558_1 /TAXON_ID=33652 /ORGANISM="Cafeteria sp., Strain Caron Lab Isolate" /LENGTH=1304 /DNA_ID=CAMNT_0042139557 /DNA_START=51 /DNA_END=3965 /DNA_ORIENTATION=+
MLLKQITDRGATIAWSPSSQRPNLLALGSLEGGGGGFDDYGGHLEVFDLDFSKGKEDQPRCLASVKTTARFSCIAWGAPSGLATSHPLGLIAGGLTDGVVKLWDASALADGSEESEIATITAHKEGVRALEFNPHAAASQLLASGAGDNKVCVADLTRPDAPAVGVPAPPTVGQHTSPVSTLAWNSKVSHILASGSQGGKVIVWDLRNKKPWSEIVDPLRASISAMAWNPDEGLHLLTASDDDRCPVLRLWDLRSSTTTPLLELSGHEKGVLSLSWCKQDPSLLATCGKDNRTLLWDLFTGKVTHEIKAPAPKGGGVLGGMGGHTPFGGMGAGAGAGAGAGIGSGGAGGSSDASMLFGMAPGAGSASSVAAVGTGRNHTVRWSPAVPAVLACASFDRRVHVHGLMGVGKESGHAPRWLRPPVGVSFGFGGSMVSFGTDPSSPGRVTISRVPPITDEASSIGPRAAQLQQAMGQDMHAWTAEMARNATDAHDREVWSFLRILYEEDARKQLLSELGFDADQIAAQAQRYSGAAHAGSGSGAGSGAEPAAMPRRNDSTASDAATASMLGGLSLGGGSSGADAADFFSSPAEAESAGDDGAEGGDEAGDGDGDGEATADDGADADAGGAADALAPRNDAERAAVKTALAQSRESATADPLVRRALLVGNFEAAVDVCLRAQRVADALLLASCGGPDLWAATRARVFEQERASSASRAAFVSLVGGIIDDDLLQLVKTTPLRGGRWREALAIVSTYGKSDEFQPLCDELGMRLETEVASQQAALLCYMCAVNLERVYAIWEAQCGARAAAEGAGSALHALVERVIAFRSALQVETEADSGPATLVARRFAQYATLLAEEGYLDQAIAFASVFGSTPDCAELLHRLNVLAPHAFGGQVVPPPFKVQHVAPAGLAGEDASVGAAAGAAAEAHAGGVAAGAAAAGGYGQVATQYGAAAAAPAAAGAYGASPWGAAPSGPSSAGGSSAASGAMAASSTSSTGYRLPTDGFVSSVGNPSLAAKYGNTPGSAATPAGTYGADGGVYGGGAATSGAYSGGGGASTYASGAYGGAAGFPTGSTAGGYAGAYSGAQAAAPVASGAPAMAGGAAYHAAPSAAAAAAGAGYSMFNPAAAAAAAGPGAVGAMGAAQPAAAAAAAAAGASGPQPTMINPYAGAAAAQGAHPGPKEVKHEAPAPVKEEPEVLGDVPASCQPLIAALKGLAAELHKHCTGADQRQLKAGEQGVERLVYKLRAGKVPEPVQQQLANMESMLRQRSIAGALGVHQALVDGFWSDHSDWLKNLKFLLSLGHKKFSC